MSGKDLKIGDLIQCNGAGLGWSDSLILFTTKAKVFVRSTFTGELIPIARIVFDRSGYAPYYRIKSTN